MLFYPRIVWRDPVGLGSVDSAGGCRCDDGCEYALKDISSHPLVPHSEWFCTKLAEMVGIRCPPCSIIDDTKGKFLFGSRWEGGVSDDKWWELAARGELSLEIIAPILTRILVFDHFVFNDDRHLGNYILRKSRNDSVFLAFDWSRSWLVNGFPPSDLPFRNNEKTILAHRYIKSILGNFIDSSTIEEIVERISMIDVLSVQRIIDDHPSSWLTSDQKSSILQWWDSDSRKSRIHSVGLGIANGSYL